ncbi:MAG TPA: GNAT family N-acetyltransferase [Salinivirgaceae bacterium]|nr:GNAT family N-acetyltransferase [Salinivirgaceae bacterium]HQA76250.1 GNAT family N-acetyltransferase [Salinivirgaceae bacterium]
MYNNENYRAFVKQHEDLPIFFQDWWMDAVCGKENWRGFVIKSGNFVKAICPLKVQKRKFGRIHYTMPRFTPYNGIYYNYPPEQKYCTKLAYEKDVINELLEQIGAFDYYFQKFMSSFTNWLPFYWNNFKQTTVYTYKIHGLQDFDSIFNNFQENIRREIRKAEKLGIKIKDYENIELIYRIAKKTFIRQDKELGYSLHDLKQIDDACKQKDCRKILFAEDNKGNIHCAIYLVWDKHTMYYLLGGGDPCLRTSGATSLLIYESIKFASTKVDCFDFEGSIIESIERFFRGFNAKQYPVMCISKKSKKEERVQRLINIISHIKKW